MVDQAPRKSFQSLARELGVVNATIPCTEHEDPNSSYVLMGVHFMSIARKQKHLEKTKKLLNWLKHADESKTMRLFSDEENSDADQKSHKRDDSWLGKDPNEAARVMHTNFPSTVMVLVVVSCEGDVMPPFIFQRGLQMSASGYVKVLEDTLKPWMDRVANRMLYVFRQDSAPAQKAQVRQNWLVSNASYWSPDLWPPSSPDLSPLDYEVWRVVERDINARTITLSNR